MEFDFKENHFRVAPKESKNPSNISDNVIDKQVSNSSL